MVICPVCGRRWKMSLLHLETELRFGKGNVPLHPVLYRRQFADVVGQFNAIGCPTLSHAVPEVQCKTRRQFA